MKRMRSNGGDAYGRSYQAVFGGLNENLAAQDGELCAMKNMSGDHYPLLSPRGQRYKTRTLGKPHGLSAQDRLCWVDGTDFYYDGQVKGQVSDSDKRLYFLNSWVVIWPDKKYYNTATGEFGSLEAEVVLSGAELCSAVSPGGISDTANCLRAAGAGFAGLFRPNEAVTISGCTGHPENNRTLVVREVEASALYFYDESFTLDTQVAYTAGRDGLAAGEYNFEYDDWYYNFELDVDLNPGDKLIYGGGLTVTALVNGESQTVYLTRGAYAQEWLEFQEEWVDYAEQGSVTIRRTVPDMDHLCECDNRLWGVKNSTVYGSYLGDPRIWYNFEGTATGCWSVEVGSGGAFTGAVSYGGYPLLFKEDHIYRVYGTKPANFQLMDTQTLGCEQGSHKSFAVVGQTLYYKSRSGIVAYSGGIPSLVDSALGVSRRKNAVAGSDGRKYYVSLSGDDGYSLYVYDTVLGLWHREDESRALDFAWCGGDLYMLKEDGSLWQCGRIRTPDGEAEAPVESEVVFADFYAGAVERKSLRRLYFRVQTSGRLTLSVAYDGGAWQEVGSVLQQRKGLQTLQLIPRRCDSFRVKLSGVGDWKLWAMGREYYTGTSQG